MVENRILNGRHKQEGTDDPFLKSRVDGRVEVLRLSSRGSASERAVLPGVRDTGRAHEGALGDCSPVVYFRCTCGRICNALAETLTRYLSPL